MRKPQLGHVERSGELQPVEADSHDALVHVRLERAGVALDRAVRFPVGPLVVPGVAIAPHGVRVQRVLPHNNRG